MFCVVQNIRQINFGQLMEVYSESNHRKASEEYGYLDGGQGILEAEQDHYAFLRDFFCFPGAFLALWAPDGKYKAALRVEPYADGFLVEGLETAPDSRRQGYGTKLLRQTLDYLSEMRAGVVYSHIANDNDPSLRVHEACGFMKTADRAVFVDGSVDHRTFTYVYKIKRQGAVD